MIFLMPMMVDNSKFYQKNKVLPEVFYFLYVGRLVKHKNVEELIKVFKSRFSTLNAELRIVGSGEEEGYLRDKYQSEKVKFLGKKFTEDLVEEFQKASCFVCPSIFEPWGLVVNEALSSGVPVIATKEVGAAFDLINGKETGYVAANMTEFGKSKLLNKKQLENLGYNLVIYPVSTQRLAMQNVEIGLKSIFNDGHQNNIIDKMQTRKRLYELVEYEKYNTPDKKITDFSTEGHE